MANPYLADLITRLNTATANNFDKLRRLLGGESGENQTKLALLNEISANTSGGIILGAVTIADGDDAAEGAIADAAATAGGVGTVSAKLRLVTSLLNALSTVEGTTADAAATAGGTGTNSAKLRLITTQLASLLTNTPAGVARTLTSSAPTTSGSISSGAKSVGATFSSDFTGSFNGATIDPAQCPTRSVSVIYPLDTLPAINYVVTTGTIYLDVLT